MSEVRKCTLVCNIAVRYVTFGTNIAHNNCTKKRCAQYVVSYKEGTDEKHWVYVRKIQRIP
jgi:hypothetical protein